MPVDSAHVFTEVRFPSQPINESQLCNMGPWLCPSAFKALLRYLDPKRDFTSLRDSRKYVRLNPWGLPTVSMCSAAKVLPMEIFLDLSMWDANSIKFASAFKGYPVPVQRMWWGFVIEMRNIWVWRKFWLNCPSFIFILMHYFWLSFICIEISAIYMFGMYYGK